MKYILPAFHSTFCDNKFNKLSKGHVDSVSANNLGCYFFMISFYFVVVCRDQPGIEKNQINQFKDISSPLERMSDK